MRPSPQRQWYDPTGRMSVPIGKIHSLGIDKYDAVYTVLYSEKHYQTTVSEIAMLYFGFLDTSQLTVNALLWRVRHWYSAIDTNVAFTII